MDRNSGIGLTLIAILLLVYFYWFAPAPEQTPPPATPAQVEDSRNTDTPQETESLPPDSVLSARYGTLAPFIAGEEKLVTVETTDVRIVFSSHGGVIHELELKNYKAYNGDPLILFHPDFTRQHLLTTYQGEELDLYNLYYEAHTSTSGENTIVTFTIPLASGPVTQTYTIPSSGYEIGYSVAAPQANRMFNTQTLSLVWEKDLHLYEKDLQDARFKSTVTYYTTTEGDDELSERSNSVESEILTDSVKWMTFKNKFFLAAIIAENNFAGGRVETRPAPQTSEIVKQVFARLEIPMNQVTGNAPANFKLYCGPNDYRMLRDVAPDFESNVYYGWPPIKWVNKFFLVPVFHLLIDLIGNFGLIIIVMVIVVRIILLPLSYRSYLSMAKMRLLKPEQDKLKEKYGDDMTKIQQEQLKLYQQAGVNPLSGCMPVLLQMPILFSMFYLFPNSIELRQQSFLWAEDLSSYDSIVNLPFSIPFYGDHVSLFTLLMTISTLIYQWQNNQLSSVQGPMKAMSYIFPVVFLFALNSFPAGLTFYYFVSNLVTFSQQAIIKRFVDEDKILKVIEENRRRHAAGGGKKSPFLSKLQEAMKASEEARKKGKK